MNLVVVLAMKRQILLLLIEHQKQGKPFDATQPRRLGWAPEFPSLGAHDFGGFCATFAALRCRVPKIWGVWV